MYDPNQPLGSAPPPPFYPLPPDYSPPGPEYLPPDAVKPAYLAYPAYPPPSYQTGGQFLPPTRLKPPPRRLPIAMMVITFVFLLIVGGAVGGYFIFFSADRNAALLKQPANISQPNQPAPITAPAPTVGPADLLKQAATNMRAAKSYHIDVDATTAGTHGTLSADLDLAKYNFKISTSTSGHDIQAIMVGSNAYLSSDGGQTFTKSEDAAIMTSNIDQLTKM